MGRKKRKKDKRKSNNLCEHSGIIGTPCNAENCNGGCLYISERKKQNDKQQ